MNLKDTGWDTANIFEKKYSKFLENTEIENLIFFPHFPNLSHMRGFAPWTFT
jgi:hypothetical protein